MPLGTRRPEYAAEAQRPDAVDPACGHFVERVVRRCLRAAGPAVRAVGEPRSTELALEDPCSRSLLPGSQPLRRMPHATDKNLAVSQTQRPPRPRERPPRQQLLGNRREAQGHASGEMTTFLCIGHSS